MPSWRAFRTDLRRKSHLILQGTIYDLPVGNQTSSNNGVAASSDFLAFLIEGEGTKIRSLIVH